MKSQYFWILFFFNVCLSSVPSFADILEKENVEPSTQTLPVLEESSEGVLATGTGERYICALHTTGQVRCWGASSVESSEESFFSLEDLKTALSSQSDEVYFTILGSLMVPIMVHGIYLSSKLSVKKAYSFVGFPIFLTVASYLASCFGGFFVDLEKHKKFQDYKARLCKYNETFCSLSEEMQFEYFREGGAQNLKYLVVGSVVLAQLVLYYIILTEKIFATSDVCIICRDDFTGENSRDVPLSCGHANMHSGCLEDYKNSGFNTCPECHQSM